MLSLTLKSNNPFAAIRLNCRNFTARYQDGREEDITRERLRELLTPDDYQTYIGSRPPVGHWVEITGHPYCEGRR